MIEQLATQFAMGCVWLSVLAVTFAVSATWPVRYPGRHRSPER